MEVHESDLEKIRDVVRTAYEHHVARDKMNALLHLANMVRFSPLTSELGSALDRLNNLLSES